MVKKSNISLALIFIILAFTNHALSFECSDKNAVDTVIQKINSAFKKVHDYSCHVEIVYYEDGAEDQRYRLKVYFKRERKIRLEFHHPYKGVTLFYDGSDEKVIVAPFRFLPALRFAFSIDNSIIKTPTGQRLDQAHMEYFVRFLLKNLKSVPQKEHECQEDEERITFSLLVLDHIEEKSLEKYRITISKTDWLPVQLERFTQEGGLIEIAVFKDYAINRQLEDSLFSP